MTRLAGEALHDPEVLRFVAESEAYYPPEANEAGPGENRRIYDRLCAAFRAPRPAGVEVHDFEIAARSPERQVPLREYRPPRRERQTRRALYLHGGGFVVGGLESHDDICAEICAGSGVAVVAVDYRLAPEHVFPAALDDAWEAYRYLAENGHEVVVAGDSAGATLCAALCLRARRLGFDQPERQVLVYPALALESSAPSYRENAEAPMLRAADCEYYRRIYAGGGKVPKEVLAEFAPLAAASFTGLAPAFVITADIDPLRDDGREYVARLRDAGISAEWRNEPQLVHGYLRARHRCRRAARSFAAIVAAIGADSALPNV